VASFYYHPANLPPSANFHPQQFSSKMATDEPDAMEESIEVKQSPTTQVFGTFELAEAIFLELGMSDLLCGVQRTCKQWKAVLDTSLPLQQTLFLKPVVEHTFQLSIIKAPETAWYSFRNSYISGKDGAGAPAIYVHPFYDTFRRHGEKQGERAEDTKTKAFIRLASSTKSPKWKDHLLTQPPLHQIAIADIDPNPCSRLKASSGVTLGQVWDALRDKCAHPGPFLLIKKEGFKPFKDYRDLLWFKQEFKRKQEEGDRPICPSKGSENTIQWDEDSFSGSWDGEMDE
jgi:hypothetical protein